MTLRRRKHWAYTALKNPDLLVKCADSLPENLRDIPEKRKRLVAALIDEHGGPARITVKEALLIDRIGRLWPYLELFDRAALDTGQPTARPADYTAMTNALARTVQALAKIAEEKQSGGETIDLTRYLGDRASDSGSEVRPKQPENIAVRDAVSVKVSIPTDEKNDGSGD